MPVIALRIASDQHADFKLICSLTGKSMQDCLMQLVADFIEENSSLIDGNSDLRDMLKKQADDCSWESAAKKYRTKNDTGFIPGAMIGADNE